jgi:hypothetical protein
MKQVRGLRLPISKWCEKNIFGIKLALFTNFEAKRAQPGSKKRKFFFSNVNQNTLNYMFQFWFRTSKLLKSFHPFVQCTQIKNKIKFSSNRRKLTGIGSSHIWLTASSYMGEIAWSKALVYDIGPASRVTACSPLLIIKLMDIRVMDKPVGARLPWWRRRIDRWTVLSDVLIGNAGRISFIGSCWRLSEKRGNAA